MKTVLVSVFTKPECMNGLGDHGFYKEIKYNHEPKIYENWLDIKAPGTDSKPQSVMIASNARINFYNKNEYNGYTWSLENNEPVVRTCHNIEDHWILGEGSFSIEAVDKQKAIKSYFD